MSNLYIYEQGIVLRYKENRLLITYINGDYKSIPIENIDNVVIFGGIQLSTACMHNLLIKGIHVTFLSKTGSYFGRLESTSNINIDRQREQFRKSDDKEFCLEIAKKFIKGKATNQRTILIRANKELKNDVLSSTITTMFGIIKDINNAKTIEELMGVEGYLARLYFNALNQIIDKKYSFKTRTKRPPKDPFNAVISFGYTLLHYEIFTILVTKGLNPYAAFLHSDRHKHPALCSDLMEEWRAILVDSLAIALLNNNKITYEDFDFDEKSGGVFLNKKACEKFVEQFEKRLRQEVSYIKEVPYKMSFRRIIEYQVMLLIKALEANDADIYNPVLIR